MFFKVGVGGGGETCPKILDQPKKKKKKEKGNNQVTDI